MKKWLSIVCLCFVASSYAGAWGLLPEASHTDTWFVHQFGQEQVTRPVCIRTYAQGESFQGLPEDSKVSPKQLVAEMENALNYWLVKPREFLQASGRQEEFADFLDILPKHITLQLQETCDSPYTLQLVYAPREWYINVKKSKGKPTSVTHKAHYTVPSVRGSDEIAWTENSIRTQSATITVYERLDLINLPQVLTHEAGHLIGLTDQYGFASYIFPGENTHHHFSYLQVSGKNTAALNNQLLLRKPASLMGNPRYHARALKTMWPDDVDGLINAVDMAQIYHHNLLSPRVVNGWKSFSLADKHIGYALAMPFKYTSQHTQPDELLARAIAYRGGEIAGLNLTEFALLQQWYKDNPATWAYHTVRASDLHNGLLAQQTRQDLAQMKFTPLTAVKIPSSVTPPTLRIPMPDVIRLRIADANGKMSRLPVARNPEAKDPNCQFYLVVTDKEITWFIKKYSRELNSIVRKTHSQQKLTRKEQRVLRWKEQLLENKHKTEMCKTELKS